MSEPCQHPINNLMTTTLQKIKEMIDVDAVVGKPIETPDGLMLIPISKLSLGFASGGSEFGKTPRIEGKNNFGGGSGAGVKVEPIAFLVIRGENVRLLPVGRPPAGPVDRAIDMVPDVVDKFTAFMDQRKRDKETL